MKLDTSESYTVCFPQERKKQKRGAQKRERERERETTHGSISGCLQKKALNQNLGVSASNIFKARERENNDWIITQC